MSRRPLLWGFIWGVMIAAVITPLIGCASPPQVITKTVQPIILIRQFVIAPAPEECCWYEPPADEDYGPL